MIDTGKKLFGFPIHICEEGESLGGDKNLPAVAVPQEAAEMLGDEMLVKLNALPTAAHNGHPAPVCPLCLCAYPSGDEHECEWRR